LFQSSKCYHAPSFEDGLRQFRSPLHKRKTGILFNLQHATWHREKELRPAKYASSNDKKEATF
jgi:hypothetical protein